MKRLCLALAALFVGGEAAYGLASMQVFYGYRLQQDGKVDRNAHVITLAGHIDPLPLIPASLGVTYAPWISYQTGDHEESATGMELGVELAGWLPMVPFVTPYAKVNYTVWGEQKIKPKGGGSESKNDLSGVSGAVGIGYDLLPLTTILVEVGYATRKIGEADYQHATMSIGVEVGI